MTDQEIQSKSTEELHKLLNEYKEIVIVEDLNQYVRKILVNSVYGALGSKHFILYNPDIADAITSQGRYSIRTATAYVVDKVNQNYPFVKLKRSLNDTDSVYFSVPGIAEQALEKNKDITDDDIVNIINKFEQVVVNPLLNESTLANFKALNDKELLLELDRESIAASQIVSGKKRYALKLLDDEGVRLSHPKYKIVGLDIKRSSTPSLMRKKLDDALRLLFDGKNKDAVEFIKAFEKEYKAKKYPITEISTPTGISDLDKFEGGDLSVPIHVRASILHNKIVKEMGLDNISPICSGDKIKWVYLKPNNKYGSNVIAYNDPDFMTITGLADKIDYVVMFDKTFMTALEKLIDAVGWKMNSSAIAMNELF